jgi:two-component system, NtrC family, nitrogen regulation sensor histidine kinase NtrY
MTVRSRKSRIWLGLGGLFVVLLLAAVFTLGSLNIPFEPRAWDEVVVLYALSTFIVAALLVFGLILGRTLVHLWAERRAEQLGSRFKTKMVLGAMAVSLLPLVFLFFISYALMNRTLNRWFPHSLETANAEMETLLREGHRLEYIRLAALAKRVAAEAGAKSPANRDAMIETAARLAAQQGAEGVWAIDSAGVVLPVGDPMVSPLKVDPSLKLARELPSGGELWESQSTYYLAASAPFGTGYLVVAHRLPADFLDLYSKIQAQTTAYGIEYQQIHAFKWQILLTLSLFTVLLLFAATWSALYLSKQVTVPIQALAEATREVAAGHLDTQVQVQAQDELGSLVRSFNAMTTQLADSRQQINDSTRNLQQAVQELDRRRTLIETVLENVPTGVLSLDPQGMILRMNTAAKQIFGEVAQEAVTLSGLVGNGAARDMQHLIRRSLRMGTASKELEFRLAGRVMHAAVTVSPLGPRRASGGYVVVIDDLTELLRAQKAAAWQEVAQRIAHEIKNPLTPIQLSAERLSRYLERHHDNNTSAPELTRLVAECSALIGQEVGTLEGLVNEFSQFARFPIAHLAPANPNDIVREALDVFHGRLDGVSIRTNFADDLPTIKADAELLRRVIVNLIDNAAEAMEGSSAKHLELTTRWLATRDAVEIAVADSGYGISPEDKDKLFLPHFSTKDRGTGLGLAIASRIIEEHHGLIRVDDNAPVGARFVIQLPAAEGTPVGVAPQDQH